MRLTFSKDSTTNSVVTDESGQIVYMFRTPRSVGTRTTTIYRAATIAGSSSTNTAPADEEWCEPGQPMMKTFGQIVHKTFTPSVFKFADGSQVTSKTFFRNPGAFWKQQKIWTGPDGKDYVWHYGDMNTHLRLGNKERTPVAQFHNPWLSALRGMQVYLDVYPLGEHMVDQIIFTLAYIQKLRREDEENAE